MPGDGADEERKGHGVGEAPWMLGHPACEGSGGLQWMASLSRDQRF